MSRDDVLRHVEVAAVGAGRTGKPSDHQARARVRHQLLRHRRHVFQRRQRGGGGGRAQRLRAAGCRGDRHEGVLPDRRASQRGRPVAEAHPSRDRRLAQTVADRLRRPLSNPSPRPAHADRRDARGAARRRQVGEGPLPRCVEHVRLAVRAHDLHAAPSRVDRVRLDAEPLQPDLSRGRARDEPVLPLGGHRLDSLEPAGSRISGG